jgi:hypothetical protein
LGAFPAQSAGNRAFRLNNFLADRSAKKLYRSNPLRGSGGSLFSRYDSRKQAADDPMRYLFDTYIRNFTTAAPPQGRVSLNRH